MTRKELKKRIDRTVSRYIIARDGVCVTCDRTDRLTDSHFIRRGKESIRWVEQNNFCQCAECNRRHDSDRKPLTNVFLLRSNLDELEALTARANIPSHFKEYHLQKLLSDWEAKLAQMLEIQNITLDEVEARKFRPPVKAEL
jgi:hypothetical protein